MKLAFARLCKNCCQPFYPRSSNQVFCSKQCRVGWQYRQEKMQKTQAELEEMERSMKAWRDKQEQDLKISVCKNCLRFQWLKEPQDFCSRGCEVVYKGH